MKKMMKKFKNERGLTLVELLAVVVILAIIAVIAFVLIGNVIENSKKDAHISNAQQLIASAKLYEANGKEIGTGVGAGQLKKEGLLDKIIDPWTKAEYTGVGDATTVGTNAVVTKSNDNVYSVVLTSDKCTGMSSAVTEAALLAEDARDTLCP